MTNTVGLQFEADTKQLKQADKDLDNLAESADNADDAIDDLGDSIDKAGKKAGKAGKNFKSASNEVKKGTKSFSLQKGAAQQAGFQIQDFAVQVQGGTSALVAFGQQGSQLAGILGPSGALIGAAIAIGSAIGGIVFKSFTNASLSAEELSERIDGVSESFFDLGEAQKSFLAKEQNKTIKERKEEIIKLTEEIKKYEELSRKTAGQGSIFTEDKGTGAAASRRNQRLKTSTKVTEDYTDKLIDLRAQLETANKEIGNSSEEVAKLTKNTELLSNQADLDLSVSFQNADFASFEEDKRRREALNLKELAEFERIEKQKSLIEERERVSREKTLLAENNKKIAFFEKDLMNARNSLLSAAELEENFYKSSLERLQEYGQLKNLAAADINSIESELYQAHLKRMEDLETKSAEKRVNNIGATFSNLATSFSIFDNLLEASNMSKQRQLDNDLRNSQKFTAAQISNKEKEAERLFNIQKEADKASISSSTAVGIMTQVAQGNFFQAGLVLSQGLLQYAKASSNSYNSPASPSGGSLTSAPPSVGNNTTNNSGGNIINLNISNNSGGQIDAESIQEYFKDGGILFDQDSEQAGILR